MWSRLTKHGLIAAEDARTEARHLGHSQIEPGHFLLALLRHPNQASNPKWGSHLPEHVATRILDDLAAPFDQLRVLALVALPPDHPESSSPETLSPACEELVAHAWDEAQAMQGDYIGTEHLLLALLHPELGSTAVVLSTVGVTADLVKTRIRILSDGVA